MAHLRANQGISNRQKITNSREKSIRKRRKRSRKVFFFFLFLIFVGIIALLSMTIFFGINKIEVIGSEKYSQTEIIDSSGVKIGENLFRINTKAIQDNIYAKFPYVGSVKIVQKLPETLRIEIKELKPVYKVDALDKCLLVDSKSKVLEEVTDPKNYDIPEVVGYDISGYSIGQYFTEKNKNKTQIVFDILRLLSDNKIDKIKFIDIKDEFEIKLSYNRKIRINLGNNQKLEEKIVFLKGVLGKIHDSETGTIDIRDTSKAYVQTQ